MKKLLFIALLSTVSYAQSISTFAGYKSAEVNFKIERDLIYGIGISVADANQVAKRATNNDHPNIHTANTKLMPSVFFLIGAQFDKVCIVGKLGAAYFEQKINGKNEPQNIYRSVGVQIAYKNIMLSYDSSNSLMLGYNFKL